MGRLSGACATAIALVIAACGRAAPSESPAAAAAPVARVAAVAIDAAAPPPPANSPPPTGPLIVGVLDPAALEAVGPAAGGLVPAERWRAIADVIAADLAAIKRGDRRAGVGLRRYAHRMFDPAWLARGKLELVGIVARFDRARIADGSCGDFRLIYRLRYATVQAGEPVASRLPMTVAVILPGAPAGGDRCAAAAARWRAPAGTAGAELGRWLVSEIGPLGGGALDPARVASILTNLQAVRWPSSVHPDLGGHAEYLFREFAPDPASGALRPVALAAVPDVARIAGDRALRERLLAWVRDPAVLAAIDRGDVSLPPELRATVSVAATPRGFSRRANRPYRTLLRPAQLADLELTALPRLRSPEGLLRRLDEQTCGGCHQARSIAGFHLLGADGDAVPPGNALAVPISAQLVTELERRRAIAEQLAAGDPPELAPPLAERAPGDPGRSGAACGLGDPAFADWTCADGLTCLALDAPADDRAVGRCVARDASAIGEPCDTGAVAPRTDPRRDRVPVRAARPCADGTVCKTSRKGFPGGMCARDGCRDLPTGAACGLIAGPGFDQCLIDGKLFSRCIADTVVEIGLRPCSEAEPCRDDYVCARRPDGGGACVPPYFLFQLRVDGHPEPR